MAIFKIRIFGFRVPLHMAINRRIGNIAPVAHQLYQRNANPRLRQLLYRLRADGDLLSGIMQAEKNEISLSLSPKADTATQNQILFHGIRLAILMHAQFACAGLPINAPPGATRDEIMERICNFDFNHVIETLSATYPASANGQEDSGRQILHVLEHCQRLVQMTSQDWRRHSALMANP